MMYNPQLETFLCVADAGSFNKAAATLYITPTAVVRQVNLLESSLGLTLSTRCSRWCRCAGNSRSPSASCTRRPPRPRWNGFSKPSARSPAQARNCPGADDTPDGAVPP